MKKQLLYPILAVVLTAAACKKTEVSESLKVPLSSALIQPEVQGFSPKRAQIASQVLGDRMFFAGGIRGEEIINTVNIYNTTTNSWIKAELSEPKCHMAAASAGDKIVFGPGRSYTIVENSKVERLTPTVDIYDSKTGKWSTCHVSEAREWCAAAGAGSKVLFAGGRTETGASDRVDIYDVNTGRWTQSRLSAPRRAGYAVGCGNKILIGGGDNTFDIYDVQENTWTRSELPVADSFYQGLVAIGNKVIATVGQKILTYDITTNTWSSQDRSFDNPGYTPHYTSWASSGNIAMFVRYDWDPDALSNTVDVYNASTNKWATVKLSECRDDAGAAAANGKFVFAGGTYDGVLYPENADIFKAPDLVALTQ